MISTKRLILIGMFAAAAALFFWLDLGRYFTLEGLKANREALQRFTEARYGLSVLLFILIYCVQTAFSLPGATILTLTGGFLFGTWLGALYANLGATSGATLAFLASRYLFRDWAERRLGRRIESIQSGFKRNGFYYLLTLRLIPIFPFFIINLACGLTRLPLSTYSAATAVGIIPGSLVYSNAGRQLGTIESLSDIASPRVLGAFVLLGLLALVPVIYQRMRRGAAEGAPGPPES